jgi:AraC-like DNA-binding protein
MKIIKTEITPLINNCIYLDYREQRYLSSFNQSAASFHQHPELQLTFILEGYGKRIIGNKVSPFEPGDMVFIGSNVPHIWLSDAAFYNQESSLLSKVITVYIDPRIFQHMFDYVKEADGIKNMIAQASKGINVFGETRRAIAEKLILLTQAEGFERFYGLLHILDIITKTTEKSLILSNEEDMPKGQSSDRLIAVLKFVKDNLSEEITLEQVAEIACMTKQSFCRFFKERTKKTFSQYLIDLRMTHACTLLIELDRPISVIASLCGYNSNSHFSKIFREFVGQTPYEFRANALKNRQ